MSTRLRYPLAALLMGVATVFVPAHAQDYWVIDGIKIPRHKTTAVEVESKAYDDMKASWRGPLPIYAIEYWEKRLGLAGELDQGKLSLETYNARQRVLYDLMMAKADAAVAASRAQLEATQARIQAEQQARADALRQQQLNLGLQLLNRGGAPQPITQTYTINGRVINCTTVGSFTNCN